jgi:hypothetical protein
MFIFFVSLLLAHGVWSSALPHGQPGAGNQSHCFPALGFKMPLHAPTGDALRNWWCDPSEEYAFLGFSYEVTACESG